MKKYFSLLLVLAMCLVACNVKNSEEQKEVITKSSEQKETSAEASVENQESFADDFSATLTKAEQGDATAQVNLGLMYEYGLGVAQDYYEAVKWYRLAAEQGEAIAQYNLGYMYEYGRGVPQDDYEAVKWYRLSAEQGDASGQGSLGVMYEYGPIAPHRLSPLAFRLLR